jgi:DNA mismatch endonuclease (patch repair protein)
VADVVTPEKRSQMMAGIRGKDTKPEMLLRRGLHRLGFRFQLHRSDLPGKPDLVLPKYDAVLFVHGCFWHGHGCDLFKWPKSRAEFWRKKIAQNQARDRVVAAELGATGWRVGEVWECALKGKCRRELDDILLQTSAWLRSGHTEFSVSGFSH